MYCCYWSTRWRAYTASWSVKESHKIICGSLSIWGQTSAVDFSGAQFKYHCCLQISLGSRVVPLSLPTPGYNTYSSQISNSMFMLLSWSTRMSKMLTSDDIWSPSYSAINFKDPTNSRRCMPVRTVLISAPFAPKPCFWSVEYPFWKYRVRSVAAHREVPAAASEDITAVSCRPPSPRILRAKGSFSRSLPVVVEACSGLELPYFCQCACIAILTAMHQCGRSLFCPIERWRI